MCHGYRCLAARTAVLREDDDHYIRIIDVGIPYEPGMRSDLAVCHIVLSGTRLAGNSVLETG